jgi:hypothetical protein
VKQFKPLFDGLTPENEQEVMDRLQEEFVSSEEKKQMLEEGGEMPWIIQDPLWRCTRLKISPFAAGLVRVVYRWTKILPKFSLVNDKVFDELLEGLNMQCYDASP